MIRAIRKQVREGSSEDELLGPYTFEDFCALVPDGVKADLLDGVIYMASPDNLEAARLFTWLIRLLCDYVEIRALGELYSLRVAFRLDDGAGPEPDIGFLSKKNLRRAFRTYIEGPPDLALEIVSPESAKRDYTTKRALYEKHRVREYWIVDEGVSKIMLLRLNSAGKYRQVQPRNGVYRSQVITGFWFREEWLWQDPRPLVRTVLRRILARRKPKP